MEKSISVCGLGLIGVAATKRLISAQYTVLGYDPDVFRVGQFKDVGGSPVDFPELFASSIVLSAVFDTNQLKAVIDAAPSGCGSLLVSLSTCDPKEMATLETRAKQKEMHLIEAPISGTSHQLASGRALFLLAGEDEKIDLVEPVLLALGGQSVRVGSVGDGNKMKLAINLILGLNRAAIAEGLTFGRAIGLSPRVLLDTAKLSAAASAVMETKGEAMVAGDFVAAGRISQSHKDFQLISSIAGSEGIDQLPFGDTYLAMMSDCLDHGEGDLDNAAIIRAIARASGLD